MNDEAGWLIEMKFGDGLLWWSGEFDRAGDDCQRARLIARMVNDAGKAVRFARREDAQRVLDGMFSARPCPIFGNAPTLYSVQEHMWPAPSQPEQQAPWREMIEDTKEVFDFNGAETPQIVRDVIEYASSWLQVAEDKAAQPVAQGPRVCWLVEEFSDTGNSTGRYMQDQSGLTITTDVQNARQFRGSRTATFRATDMREKWGTAWRPVSHVYRAAQPQQATEPAPEVDAAIALLHRMLEAPTNWITPAWKDAIRPVLAGLITQGRSVDAQPQQATAGPVLTDDEIVSALKSCEQEDHAQAGWVWRQRVKWCRAIEAAVIAKLGGAA